MFGNLFAQCLLTENGKGSALYSISAEMKNSYNS